jgi:hypothetical protein
MSIAASAEKRRLDDAHTNWAAWKKWGPYLKSAAMVQEAEHKQEGA